MGYGPGDSFPFDFKPNGNPYMVRNRKENCRHDHISLNLKGNGRLVFSVQGIKVKHTPKVHIFSLKYACQILDDRFPTEISQFADDGKKYFFILFLPSK